MKQAKWAILEPLTKSAFAELCGNSEAPAPAGIRDYSNSLQGDYQIVTTCTSKAELVAAYGALITSILCHGEPASCLGEEELSFGIPGRAADLIVADNQSLHDTVEDWLYRPHQTHNMRANCVSLAKHYLNTEVYAKARMDSPHI